MTAHSAEVLIVGAGVAGLSAATVFLREGWRVRMVDKAMKPGGRCATRRVDAAADAAWFDTGAQYFTAQETEFVAWLHDWRRSGHVAVWSARLGRGNPAVAVACEDAQPRYAGVGGMNAWLRAWATELQEVGLELFCQTRATRLVPAASGVQVIMEDGRQWSAQHVLLTPPAPQSLALLPTGTPTPDWPTLEPCLAVTIRARPHWAWEGLFEPHPDLAWVAVHASKPGAPAAGSTLWIVHAGVRLSALACTQRDEAVAELLAIVADVMEGPVEWVHTHLWRYAAAPRELQPPGFYRHPLEPRILAAGDWLYGGRIEGAWHSGRLAAEACVSALPCD